MLRGWLALLVPFERSTDCLVDPLASAMDQKECREEKVKLSTRDQLAFIVFRDQLDGCESKRLGASKG